MKADRQLRRIVAIDAGQTAQAIKATRRMRSFRGRDTRSGMLNECDTRKPKSRQQNIHDTVIRKRYVCYLQRLPGAKSKNVTETKRVAVQIVTVENR